MDMKEFFYNENEKPLDNLVTDGGFCSIFRNICLIGDSLSAGEFEGTDENGNKTYHDFVEDYSWGKFLMRMCGSNGYVFARGGMTAKEYVDSFAKANNFWDKTKACQCYIIALGVNDCNQINIGNIELGSTEDIDVNNYKNNKQTFVGYYATIIQRYKEIQPDAKFFLLTMPIDEIYDMPKDHPVPASVRKAIKDIAKLFGAYVLELDKYLPEYCGDIRKTFYMGGHLAPTGYVLTAKFVASYIDYYIRKYPNDFKQVGFIGTEFRNTNI